MSEEALTPLPQSALISRPEMNLAKASLASRRRPEVSIRRIITPTLAALTP